MQRDGPDSVATPDRARGPDTARFPRAGKAALCVQRLAESSKSLEREVERAIDRRAIGECHRQYLSRAMPEEAKEGSVELSFVVGEDGRITVPKARSIDYIMDACIERAVDDTCVGVIVDDQGRPTALSFTIEMYVSR